MKTMVTAGMLGAGLLVATVSATVAQRSTQDRYVLDGDPAIYALAGEVEVVRGSGDRVEVVVEFRGRDADRLSVDVEEIRGRHSLVVRFPDEDVVYDRGTGSRYNTTLRVRDDGTWGGDGGMGLFGGDRVRVSSGGDGLEAHAVVRVEVPAGRDADVLVGVGGIRVRDLAADLDLDVRSGAIDAEGVTGFVSADTGSGDIRLVGIDGSISADTGSGDVVLEGVRGDEISADTGSGDIRMTDAVAGELDADTGSGRVEMIRVEGREVLVGTGSGDVDIDLVAAVSSLEVDTGSGDVTVRFGAAVDADIEVDTGSGGIDIDLAGLVTEESERGYFSGRVGRGVGTIEIDTGSGRVRLLPIG
jgi:hypothetical protein